MTATKLATLTPQEEERQARELERQRTRALRKAREAQEAERRREARRAAPKVRAWEAWCRRDAELYGLYRAGAITWQDYQRRRPAEPPMPTDAEFRAARRATR